MSSSSSGTTSAGSDRIRITVTSDYDEDEVYWIKPDSKFKKVIDRYQKKVNKLLVLTYHGETITATTTPRALGMESGAVINAVASSLAAPAPENNGKSDKKSNKRKAVSSLSPTPPVITKRQKPSETSSSIPSSSSSSSAAVSFSVSSSSTHSFGSGSSGLDDENPLWLYKELGDFELCVRAAKKATALPSCIDSLTSLVSHQLCPISPDDDEKLKLLLYHARDEVFTVQCHLKPKYMTLPCCPTQWCECSNKKTVYGPDTNKIPELEDNVRMYEMKVVVRLLPTAGSAHYIKGCNKLLSWVAPRMFERFRDAFMSSEECKSIEDTVLGCQALPKLAMRYEYKPEAKIVPAAVPESQEDEADDLTITGYTSGSNGEEETEKAEDLDSETFSKRCGLAVTLRDYQRQTVEWMLEREATSTLAPFFGRMTFESGFACWYSPLLERFHLQKDLPNIRGGFLTEQMGLGKTIEMIATMNANLAHKPSLFPSIALRSEKRGHYVDPPSSSHHHQSRQTGKSEMPFSRATLIITPSSLLGQWQNELHKRVTCPYKILVMGSGLDQSKPKERSIHQMQNCDILLTTYTWLRSMGRDSNLHKVIWHRIVLDESHHYIKDTKSLQAQVVCALQSPRRWLLSGTPVNNTPMDIVGQVKFLGLDSFQRTAVQTTLREMINHHKPVVVFHPYTLLASSVNDCDPGLVKAAFVRVFSHLMMRHTKDQHFNGREKLLELKGFNERTIRVQLSPRERAAYDRLMELACHKCKKTRARRNMPDNQKMINLRGLLLPLRKACSYGLVDLQRVETDLKEIKQKTARKEKGAEAKEAAAEQEAEDNQPFNSLDGECVICLDAMDDPLQTACRHAFCRECIMTHIQTTRDPLCPMCRTAVSKNDLSVPPPPPKPKHPPVVSLPAPKHREAFSLSAAGLSEVLFDAKLKLLMQQLAELQKQKPAIKALVFSQFTGTIEAIAKKLQEAKISNVLLTGGMSTKERQHALAAFEATEEMTVFLLSVKAGSVGLTLTAASHVFMFEPCMNPALTAQAVNRVYRIGQENVVYINHLVIANTLEERIMELTAESRKSGTSLDIAGPGSEEADVRAGGIDKDVPVFRMNDLLSLFKGLDTDSDTAAGEEITLL